MAGSLGVATLESAFDPGGLRRGLADARAHTEGWLSGWRNLWNVTAGFIIAQVIGKIAGAIRDMGRDVLYAVSQFQLLEIQLKGLVAGELFSGGGFENFNDALTAGSGRVKELIGWIKTLAVTTPFTVETLQRTLANAMAMGFTSKEAQSLTMSIGNFTAGMGLSQEVMERIIYNFGQMKAAGKVTGTELRDLARGGFVPIVDILHRMQENLGMTNISFEEFRELAGAGKVEVGAFFDAFEQMVGERFPNSMEQMAKTFAGLTSNIKDFFQSVLGAGVLGPAFNKITAGLADTFAQVMKPEMLSTFDALGRTLARFVDFDPDMSWLDTLQKNLDNLNSSLQRFSIHGDVRKLLEDLHVPQETIDLMFKIGDALKWVSDNMDTILAVGGALLAGNIFMGIASGVIAFIAALASGAWIPLLIGALIVGVILLAAAWQTNFGGMRDKLLAFSANVQSALMPVKNFLVAVFGDEVSSLITNFSSLLAQLGYIFAPLAQAFERFLPILIKYLGSFLTNAIAMFAGLIGAILNAIGLFLSIAPVIMQGLSWLMSGLLNIISGFWTFITGIFSMNGKQILEGLMIWGQGLLQIVGGIFILLIGIFGAQLAFIWGLVIGFIDNVIAFFQNLSMVLVGGSIIPNMLTLIVMTFTTSLNIVLNLIRSIFSLILSIIQMSMANAIMSVRKAISFLIFGFMNLAIAGDFVVRWIQSKFAAAFEAARAAVAKVLGAVNALLNALKKLAEQMPAMLTPGSPTPFERGLWGIHDAMDSLRSQAVPSLGGAFDSQLNLTPSLASSPSSLMAGMGLSAGGSKQYNFYMQKSDLDEDQLRRALQRAEVLYG